MARDAGVSAETANVSVESQLGSNYTRESDGMLMSNVEVGDKVVFDSPVVDSKDTSGITTSEAKPNKSVSKGTKLFGNTNTVGHTETISEIGIGFGDKVSVNVFTGVKTGESGMFNLTTTTDQNGVKSGLSMKLGDFSASLSQ